MLTVRLTPQEHAAIIEAAAKATLPPSSYARQAIIGAPVTVKTFVSLAPEDLAQLKRLGNLLNQIARSGWRGRYPQQTAELLAIVSSELRITFRRLSRPTLAP